MIWLGFASWLGWDSAVIKPQWTLKSEKCGRLEGNELHRLFLLLFCNVSLGSNSSSLPFSSEEGSLWGSSSEAPLFFLQVSIKWMVERSTADEALKEAPRGRAASARRLARGRQALRRFTSQFADKTPLKQKKKNPRTTSAANLAPAFLRPGAVQYSQGLRSVGTEVDEGDGGERESPLPLPLLRPFGRRSRRSWKMRG